ncbi:MAG: hypothetical protein ABI432_15935 [Flavobacteriales bacterium]
MRRTIAIATFLFALLAPPSSVKAQLNTRENSSTNYSSQAGGIPDPLATWLESDVDVPPMYPGG